MIDLCENFPIDQIIGSDPDRATLCLRDTAKVAPVHAAIRRTGSRVFLRDLGSKYGTWINERTIGGRWVEVARDDRIYLGSVELVLDPGVFYGTASAEIVAWNLEYAVRSGGRKGETLCDHVSFFLPPATFTAVMGPSGCGKTILLSLLSGEVSPTCSPGDCRVLVNEGVSVYENRGIARQIIGLVPQDDTLIPELTVNDSLDYWIRTLYPGMEPRIRRSLIHGTLAEIGIKEDRRVKILDTLIGSPDSPRRGLSGGERKQVHIAHELVRRPRILILDEPTSGLSSVDAHNVILQLHKLSRIMRTTVVMSIHQPSEEAFRRFDLVMILNPGGKLVFYGPPRAAVKFFEDQSATLCGAKNPAEFVLEALAHWPKKVPPEQKYRSACPYAKVYLPEEPPVPAAGRKEQAGHREQSSPLRQIGILLQRNLSVLISDRWNLLFLLLQAPLIAMLIVMTFRGFPEDTKGADLSVLTILNAHWDRYVWEESVKKAKEMQEGGSIAEPGSQRYASLLFLLSAVAIWFGSINSCREIVGDRLVLRRERRGGLNLTSYLAAKFVVLLVLGIIQTMTLVAVVGMGLNVEMNWMAIWGILVLVVASGTGIGLLISAAVKTERQSLAIIPLVILPQLIAGGLIRPAKFLTLDAYSVRPSDVILQSWGFESLLRFGMPENGHGSAAEANTVDRQLVYSVNFKTEYLDYPETPPPSDLERVEEGRSKIWVHFFGERSYGNKFAVSMIALHGFLYLMVSCFLLHRTYR